MKIRKRIAQVLSIFCMLAVTLLSIQIPVCAKTATNATKHFNLTLNCEYSSEPVANQAFRAYKVADISSSGSYVLTDDFKNYQVDYSKLNEEEWKELGNVLAAYTRMDKLDPQCSGTTDKNGKLVFDDSQITKGVYLVVGDSVKNGDKKYTVEPFFVAVTGQDVDVEVNPKYKVEVQMNHVDLTALKIWKDEDAEDERPESIEVYLLKNGEISDTVTLSEDNSWRYKWTNLAGDAQWDVMEKEIPKGYTLSTSLIGRTYSLVNEYVHTSLEDPSEVTTESTETTETTGTTETTETTGTDVSTETSTSTEIPLSDPGTQSSTETSSSDTKLPNSPKSSSTNTTQNAKNGTKLPQTGLYWWPVPMLIAVGLVLIILGTIRNQRNRGKSENEKENKKES
jgi:hypothetical protein